MVFLRLNERLYASFGWQGLTKQGDFVSHKKSMWKNIVIVHILCQKKQHEVLKKDPICYIPLFYCMSWLLSTTSSINICFEKSFISILFEWAPRTQTKNFAHFLRFFRCEKEGWFFLSTPKKWPVFENWKKVFFFPLNREFFFLLKVDILSVWDASLVISNSAQWMREKWLHLQRKKGICTFFAKGSGHIIAHEEFQLKPFKMHGTNVFFPA